MADYNTYVLIKGITMVELGYFMEDPNRHSSKKDIQMANKYSMLKRCSTLLIIVYMLSHSVVSNSLWPHGHMDTRQAPLSMGLYQQEYLSVLPFTPLGDLPDPGIEPLFLVAIALTGGLLTTEPPGKLSIIIREINIKTTIRYRLILVRMAIMEKKKQ